MQANRRLIIGGNWKCNLTQNAATALINNVLNKLEYNHEKVEVLVAPIALHIPAVKAQLN
jgi:triosephosphate isomerase